MTQFDWDYSGFRRCLKPASHLAWNLVSVQGRISGTMSEKCDDPSQTRISGGNPTIPEMIRNQSLCLMLGQKHLLSNRLQGLGVCCVIQASCVIRVVQLGRPLKCQWMGVKKAYKGRGKQDIVSKNSYSHLHCYRDAYMQILRTKNERS